MNINGEKEPGQKELQWLANCWGIRGVKYVVIGILSTSVTGLVTVVMDSFPIMAYPVMLYSLLNIYLIIKLLLNSWQVSKCYSSTTFFMMNGDQCISLFIGTEINRDLVRWYFLHFGREMGVRRKDKESVCVSVCVGKKVWEILRGGYRSWRPALQMFGYPAIFLPFPFPCSVSTGSHDSTSPFPYTHMHPHTSTVSRRLGEHSSVAPLGSL